ncbi:DUF1571 domain-containing protein [Hymenobacter sp. BT175]|uniref:DUF1571 domain-containing protein n=1 Tax=Hymenobacter translucens TaxID=2886507 RepID=UPI001D0E200E|nr:DUF1571 domain-containing protein [Hymenobacter translucens]MCC2546332.1 DUF1571 domain-containing protein [Hymenobacter translucens]
MTRFLRLPVPIALVLTALAAASPPEKITTEQLITRLSSSIDNLKTLRCTARAQERVNGVRQQAQSNIKMAYAPLRIYLRNEKGIEVLWVAGQNNGDAWVYPNSFPFVTVSLNPNGSMMRRSQHHSVLNAGFGTISSLIHGSSLRQDRSFERSFRYAGDTTVLGRACYILRSDFPQFKYVTYKVGKGETVAKVAERFGCGEYRIMERNGVAIDEPIPEGKVLQVPNAYGRRTIVCVDQKQYLPVVVQVVDDKGLFEKFEFTNVVANQPIAPAEFTKTYKGYKF